MKRKIRREKRNWTEGTAKETEEAANKQHMKTPSEDMITAELLKADLEFTTDRVRELMDMIWSLEKVPHKWKRGLIIKIPKKGNLKKCKNWRGSDPLTGC